MSAGKETAQLKLSWVLSLLLGAASPGGGGGGSLSGTWGNSWVGNAVCSRISSRAAWKETGSKTYCTSSGRQGHRRHCFSQCLPAPCRPHVGKHVRVLALQRSHYLMVTLL